MKSSAKPGLARVCLVAFMLLTYSDTYVLGAPRGGHVVSGSASFTQDGNLTVITAANRTIINFQSFNVAGNEIVRFVQPNSTATVLDRVTSPSPTNIFGQIQANGIVYIVNPYGVYFKDGAVINAASLYAGAGRISNADFTSGDIHFTDLSGDVRNDGIVAADNQIALLGANVVNNGTLTSAHGAATLVSGRDVYIGERNRNIFVQANGAPVPAAASGSITNRGTVSAPRVLMGAGDLYSTAIVNSGLLQGRNIAVNAGRNGSAQISGRLDASSAKNPAASGKGGNIEVLGGKVALRGAHLDANGRKGGGTVRVGGDFKGGGKLLHSATTMVDAGTTIRANATGAAGNGGSVILWSDKATNFAGEVSARGGFSAGNGGSAQVSSNGALAFTGLVDLRAPGGTTGLLLLDPHNISISNTGTTTVGGTTFSDNPATNYTINSTDLGAELALASVTLQANTDIEFTANATVTAAVGTGNLTLEAGRSILFDSGASLTLRGSLMATFNDIAAIPTAVDRDTGAASFTMAAGSQINAPGGVTIAGSTLAAFGDGTTTTATTVTANTGQISLTTINANAGAISISNAAAMNREIEIGGPITGGSVTMTVGGTIRFEGGSVTTSGSGGQSYHGAVALQSATSPFTTTLMANGGGPILFSSSIDQGTPMQGLSLTTTGAVTFSGAVGNTEPIQSLSVTAGTINLNGGAVSTDGGGQTYTGAVVLGASGSPGDTNLADIGHGAIDFTSTISAATPQILSLSTTGIMTLGGIVGPTTPLAGFFAGTGTVDINGGAVNTKGNQTYDGGISLGAATTLTSTMGGLISLGAVDGAQTLAVNSTAVGGQVLLGGAIGAGTALTSLNVAAPAGITFDGATVRTTGGQTYTGPGTLDLGTTLTSTMGGTISLGTVDGAQTLALSSAAAGGQVALAGALGAGTALTSVNITAPGGITFAGATVKTTGDQTYTGPGTLDLGTTLTSTAGGTISLGAVDGAQTLTLSSAAAGGKVALDGAIGAGVGTALTSLNVTAPAGITFDGATVKTTGDQTYAGPGTLDAGTTLTSTAGGTISVEAVDGAQTLALSSAAAGGTVVLNGAIGGGTPLTSLSITAPAAITFNGATVQTTGDQTYAGPGTLDLGTTLTSTTDGTISLGAVDGAQTLTLSSAAAGGKVALDGAVGANTALASLDVTAPGSITFDGATVKTTGDQTYTGPGTLAAGTTLTSTTGGTMTLQAVDGAQTLAVSSLGTGGQVVLDGAIGASSALTSLNVAAAAGITFDGAAVRTTGDQTYTGAGTLDLGTTLTSTQGGTISLGAVDGAQTLALSSPAAGGQVTLQGAIGASTALTSLDVSAPGAINFNGGTVQTTGEQTYSGPGVLGVNTTLTSTTGGTISLAAVNGAKTLTLTSTGPGGQVTLDGAIGSGTALTSLAVAATGINFDGGPVTTTGDQTYMGPEALGVATSLTSTAGGTISLETVDGAQTLAVSSTAAGGQVTLNEAIGGMTPLTSLNVAAGTAINFAGGTVNTTGGQIYTGPGLLDIATTLTSSAGGTISLGAIDGAQALTVGSAATGGQVTLGGAIGSGTALTSLAITAPAAINFDGGTVRTTGDQTYAGPGVLGLGTILTSTGGGNISLEAVNGAQALTASSAAAGGQVTLDGAIGSGTALLSLSATAGLSINLNGGAVTTSGAAGQTYHSPLVLGATLTPALTTLTANNGGLLTFDSTVNGSSVPGAKAQDLSLATTGAITLSQAVGGTTPLLSLATTQSGTVHLDGGAITTSGGGQSYAGPVVLGSTTAPASTTLTDTASGAISFLQTLNGNTAGTQALVVNTAGNETFDGVVGTTALSSLTTDSTPPFQGGQAHINTASITTTGAQTYNDQVVLGSNTTLTGSALTLAAGLNGSPAAGTFYSLVADFSAAPVLVSPAIVNLNDFSSIGTGGTQIDGAFSTRGFQDYANAVTLTGNSALTAGGAIIFGTTLNGAFALTASTSGQTTFDGPVGGTTPLLSLVTGPGATALDGGSVNTLGLQTYGGAVTLGQNTVLNSQDTNGDGGAITFGSTVDGLHNLALNTPGNEVFNGRVGSLSPLLSLTTDASIAPGGTTIFNVDSSSGPAVTTVNDVAPGGTATGAQTYHDAVLLEQATVLTSGFSGAATTGGAVTFDGTVDSFAGTPENLTVTAGVGRTVIAPGATFNVAGLNLGGAQVVFNAPVGSLHPLNILTVGQNGSLAGVAPSIDINDGGFTTSSGQSYSDAVVLSLDTVLKDTSGQPIVFLGAVNGDGVQPRMLTLSTTGSVTFHGLVGNIQPLRSLLVTAAGGTFFDMTAAAGAGVDAGSVDIEGPVTFNVAGVGLANLAHPTVLTTGAQTYDGNVTLSQNTSLYASAGGNITLNGLVNGGVGLALNTAGNEIFDGTVGGASPLTSLAVDTLIAAPAGETEFLMSPAAGTAGVRVGAGGVTIADAVLFDVTGSTLAAPTVLTFGGGTQTYLSAATLSANTFLVGDSPAAPPAAGVYSGGGAILFGSTITGTGAPNLSIFTGAGATMFQSTVATHSLAVIGALATFDGAVSGLGAFTIAPNAGAAGGPIDINGGDAGGNTVTTAAGQTYGSPVVLGADTRLGDTGAANITFDSTVNGTHALTTGTAGETTFDGLVGSNVPLAALTSNNSAGTTLFNMAVGTAAAGVLVNGPVVVNGAAIFAVTGASLADPGVLTINNAAQTYGGAVSLAANTYLVSAAGLPATGAAFTGGGAIAFTSPAGIASTGGTDLYVRAGTGTTTFASTINAGTVDLGGANVTFDGPVTVPGVLSVESNAGTGGTLVLAGGGLTTAGAQAYNAAVILGADTVLTSLNTAGGGGNIVFTSTVNSDATPRALAINTSGDEVFDGIVGGTNALARLSTDATGTIGGSARFNMNLNGAPAGVAGVNVAGAVTINDAVVLNVTGSSLAAGGPLTVSSGGTQTYHGAATLTQDTSLASSGTAGAGGNVVFDATVNSGAGVARGLAISTPGDEVFNGLVGGSNELASLTTDTAGNLGGTARFNMNGTGAAAGVNVLGAVTINDLVAFNVSGTSLTAGPASVSTGGAQTYAGAALLEQNTRLVSTGDGLLTFNSTVNSANGLALSSAGGDVFDGIIGGVTPLMSLTASGGSTAFNMSLANAPQAAAGVSVNGPLTVDATVSFNVAGSTAAQPSVLTTGNFAQTYDRAVTLLQNTVLASSGAGNLVFAATVDGGSALSLATAGAAIFDQTVGGKTALLSLATSAASTAMLDGGSIATTESQTYGGPVVLGAATTLTSQNTAGKGGITFAKTVNGPDSLAVDTAAATTFAGAVGENQPLASITTDSPGTTILGGLSVRTMGLQAYNDAVLLTRDATLHSAHGTITFGQTVDASGQFALNLSSPAEIIFDGAVGSTQVLGSLKIAPGAVATILNGKSITTSGLQTFGSPVTLAQGAVLTSKNAGAVTFAKSVDGPFALTIATAGNTVFDGAVGAGGGNNALASLTTAAQGAAYFANGTVDTTGAQNYAGAVHLQADATFTSTSTGGDIAFRQTVDGPFSLTANSGHATIFNGEVSQLTGLLTEGPGTTEFSGGNVAIAGAQTYDQPVALNANAGLAGTAVTFDKSVYGAFNLALEASGKTTFDAAVGANNLPLASLTTGPAGTTVFAGGAVNTTGLQTYGNLAQLAAASTTLTSARGDITFQRTINGENQGANALSITSVANALQGSVGAAVPLSSLTVAGPVSIGGATVQTTLDQHYANAVNLGAPLATLTSLTKNLLFDQSVTSTGSVTASGLRIISRGDMQTAGNLDLETNVNPASGAVHPLLILAGSTYASSNGQVLFNTSKLSTPDQAEIDDTTIILTNPGTVKIEGTGFTMGYLQKLLALGSVDIDVHHGVADVGDLAARDNLQIVAGEVGLLNRPAETAAIPGTLNNGLNFVAGKSIDFGSARIVFLNKGNQVANFITSNNQTTIQRVFGISLFEDPTLFLPNEPNFSTDSDSALENEGNPIQPVGGGIQSLDTAAALSGALPDQKPLDVAEDITISASQMEELKKLGIHPRLAKNTERTSAASKRALFAQLVDGEDQDNYGLLQPIKGGVSRLQPSDYVVVVDRMGEQEVQSILGSFEVLYGKNKEKAPEIGAAFNTAYTDYTLEKKTDDPAGFSPYLQSHPGKYPAVDKAVRGFDDLFGHIEHLGLTDKEVAKSEEHIVSDLGVQGPSSEDMVKVINSLRQKLPPSQKAGSNSAPPSAPAGNPAPGATTPSAPPPASPAPSASPAVKTAALSSELASHHG